MSNPEEDVKSVAETLRQERVRFAEEFAAARFRLGEKGTDRQAHEAAVAKTQGALTIAEAYYQIALARLKS